MSRRYVSTTIQLLQPYDGDMSWQGQAECRRTNSDGTLVYPPEMFFPASTTGPGEVQTEQAKAVCHRCPSEDACREWALDTLEFGVAGGLDEEQRRTARRERARAAREAVTT